ncbi:hypothetical protein BH11PLA2_BH11PLA2_41560 [soil metagenome]
MSRLQAWRPKYYWYKTPKSAPPRRSNLLRVLELEDRITPATFTVNSTSDAVVADGNLTLREAIGSLNLGNNNDLSAAEKLLVTGTYGTSDVISLTGVSGTITLGGTELAIGKPATITGPGATLLAISGNNSCRIINASSAGSGSTITVTNVTLTSGSASRGGAVLVGDQSLSLTNCILISNLASDRGGAIAIDTGGTLNLTRSTLSGNTATFYGGGVNFDSGGSAFVSESAIINNKVTTTIGGGLNFIGHITTGGFTVLNSTIAGNSSAQSGGGLSLQTFTGESVTVQNSTIVNNTAAIGVGGGILVDYATLVLTSSIVSGNSNTNAPDVFSYSTVNANFSAIGSSSGVIVSGVNNLAYGTNLMLGMLSNNGGSVQTILPEVGSPVRDAGSNPSSATTDARGSGFPRELNAVADIGAVEAPPVLVVRNTSDSGRDSFRQQVLDSNNLTGTDTITFSSLFNTPQTILITSGEFSVTDSLTISGPGANLLTVNGNNTSRFINTSAGKSTTVTAISGINIIGCFQNVKGGAFLVGDEQLVLDSVSIQNNSSNNDGGGICVTVHPVGHSFGVGESVRWAARVAPRNSSVLRPCSRKV